MKEMEKCPLCGAGIMLGTDQNVSCSNQRCTMSLIALSINDWTEYVRRVELLKSKMNSDTDQPASIVSSNNPTPFILYPIGDYMEDRQYMHIRNYYFNHDHLEMFDDPFGGITVMYRMINVGQDTWKIQYTISLFNTNERFSKREGRFKCQYLRDQHDIYSEVELDRIERYMLPEEREYLMAEAAQGKIFNVFLPLMFANFRDAFARFLRKKHDLKSKYRV